MTGEPDPNDGQAVWRTIELAIAQLFDVARSGGNTREFYDLWLQGVVQAVAADGGCVWQAAPDSPPAVVAQRNFPPSLLQAESADRICRRQLAQPSGKPMLAATQPQPEKSSIGEFAADERFVVCAQKDPAGSHFITALYFGPAVRQAVLAGAVQVLAAFREAAIDFHRQQEIEELRKRLNDARQFDELTSRMHQQLHPLETAYTIANDSRTWIGCDRVGILRVRGRNAELIALSGVDMIDRRSEEVIRLEQLAVAAMACGDPLIWSSGKPGNLAPQVEEALQHYVDRAHVRTLALQPLRYRIIDRAREPSAEMLGVLVAESFQPVNDDHQFLTRTAQIAAHAETALGNAVEHHSVPLRALHQTLRRYWRRVRRRYVASLIATTMLAGLIVAAFTISVDFNLEANGTLEPEVRRNLFAPADGIVERVHAGHGDHVESGEEVVSIRSERLELEHGKTNGELQTLHAKLTTLRAKRSSGGKREGNEDERLLAAEEEQVKQQIRGLENQLKLLAQLRQELIIVAPIAGLVLTWNANELLQDRPVKQGQLLLTLADTTGPWLLELHVADRAIGHLIEAQSRSHSPVAVSFLLASDTTRTLVGRVDRIALSTNEFEGDTPATLVTVRFDATQLPNLRAGTGVVARIRAGRRSLAYVWLHDVLDTLRTHVLF